MKYLVNYIILFVITWRLFQILLTSLLLYTRFKEFLFSNIYTSADPFFDLEPEKPGRKRENTTSGFGPFQATKPPKNVEA